MDVAHSTSATFSNKVAICLIYQMFFVEQTFCTHILCRCVDQNFFSIFTDIGNLWISDSQTGGNLGAFLLSCSNTLKSIIYHKKLSAVPKNILLHITYIGAKSWRCNSKLFQMGWIYMYEYVHAT